MGEGLEKGPILRAPSTFDNRGGGGFFGGDADGLCEGFRAFEDFVPLERAEFSFGGGFFGEVGAENMGNGFKVILGETDGVLELPEWGDGEVANTVGGGVSG